MRGCRRSIGKTSSRALNSTPCSVFQVDMPGPYRTVVQSLRQRRDHDPTECRQNFNLREPLGTYTSSNRTNRTVAIQHCGAIGSKAESPLRLGMQIIAYRVQI